MVALVVLLLWALKAPWWMWVICVMLSLEDCEQIKIVHVPQDSDDKNNPYSGNRV